MRIQFLENLLAVSSYYFGRSGVKHKGLRYRFDDQSGTLFVSGLGKRVTRDGVFTALNNNASIIPFALRRVEWRRAALVNRLGHFSFNHSLGLTSIELPPSLLSISETAFQGCHHLTELRCSSLLPPKVEPDPFFYTQIYFCFVPKGTRDLYMNADGWRSYARSWVFIEQPVEAYVEVLKPGTIGASVFKQSTVHPSKVTHLKVSGTLNDDDFIYIRTRMPSLYCIDLSGISNSSLPDGAFEGSHLSKIVFPTGLISIGKRAFCNCRGLSGELALPPSLLSIDDYAFNGCSGICGCNLPFSVTSIGCYAFAQCVGLRGKLILPPNLVYLGEFAFSQCLGLSGEVVIPKKVVALADSVFANCSTIESVVLSNVLTIGQKAFCGCVDLKQIVCPQETPPLLVGGFVFEGVSVEQCAVVIPTGQFSIHNYFSNETWSVFTNYKTEITI